MYGTDIVKRSAVTALNRKQHNEKKNMYAVIHRRKKTQLSTTAHYKNMLPEV